MAKLRWLAVAEEVKKAHESGRYPTFWKGVDIDTFGKGVGQFSLHHLDYGSNSIPGMLGTRAALHWAIDEVGASRKLHDYIETLWKNGQPGGTRETIFAFFGKETYHPDIIDGVEYLRQFFSRCNSGDKFERFSRVMNNVRQSAHNELLFHVKRPEQLRRIHRFAPKIFSRLWPQDYLCIDYASLCHCN